MNRIKYIAFLVGAMIMVPVASAQNDSTSLNDNPLVAITGPNVLPAGKIQWNSALGWDYRDFDNELHLDDATGDEWWLHRFTSHLTSLNTSLRFGVGGKSEIVTTMEGGFCLSKRKDNGERERSYMFVPSVGVKVNLYDGSAHLPQVTFRTDVTVPMVRLWNSNDNKIAPEPSVELMLRKVLRRVVVDISLGYGWHSYSTLSDDGFRYTTAVTWLPTDRLALGVSYGRKVVHALANPDFHIANLIYASNMHHYNLTAMYRLTDDLQLSLEGSVVGSATGSAYSMSSNLMLGVHWMIR